MLLPAHAAIENQLTYKAFLLFQEGFFGSVIRVDADLVHFALTAMFIFMFVMQMKNALLIFTGLFSGVLGDQ